MKKVYPYGFVITFVWIGFLVAISFMEAPLKFQAESVTTAIGVEIGVIVFHALNKVELIFSVLLITTLGIARKLGKKLFYGILALICIVAIQTLYLLPVLDSYAEIVVKGGKSPSNTVHILYVIFEIVKLILLIYTGIQQVRVFKKLIKHQLLSDFEID